MTVDKGQTAHPYVCEAVRILSLPINTKSPYQNLAWNPDLIILKQTKTYNQDIYRWDHQKLTYSHRVWLYLCGRTGLA